jgi:eukaryotic-like serine/threonine-protein kinase
VIGERAGERYALSERLGSGGTSSVWRARDTETGGEVAVKVLHLDATDNPEAVARFEREARLVSGLHSANIVGLLDRGEIEGRPFLVFELVEGVDLREYLRRNAPVPVADAVAIGLQVANGLAAAHALRIVHRDLKPGNVLIDDAGRVRVADFGIARAIEDPGITQPGRVVGTGEYVSPEQALGKPLDERCDLYALGVLLYEMLSGRPPFRGASFADVAARHVRAPVPPLQEARPDIPDDLRELVEALLAKSPAARPAPAAAIRDRLRAMLSDLEGGGPIVAAALDRRLDAPSPAPTVVPPLPPHLDDVAPWEDVTPASMDFPLPALEPEEPLTPYRVPPSARENSGHLRWIAVVALLVAVAAAVAVLLSGGGHGPAATTAARSTTPRSTTASTASVTPASTPAPAVATVAIGDVGIFDPPPGGDNSENDDQTQNATDGDSTTWWETETYKTGDLTHGKGGVGLVLSPDRASALAAVEIQTPAPGIVVTVYAARSAATPASLAGWRIASAQTVIRKNRQRIPLLRTTSARHVMLWISGLVKASSGGYTARIAEVRLFGQKSASG